MKALWVFLPLLSLLVYGPALTRSKTEEQEIESRLLWSHDFPGSLTFLEITPKGFIHAVSRYGDKIKVGKEKFWKKKRFLLKDNEVLWEGEESETIYAGDAPSPLVLQATNEGVVLQAVQNNWKVSLKGIPISWTTDADLHLVVVTLMPVGWTKQISQKQTVTLVAINSENGSQLWATPLGLASGSPESFGSEIGIQNGRAWWAAGGLAASVQIADGRLVWSSPVEETTGPNSLWSVSSSGAAVSRGDRLFLLDPDSGPRWTRQIRVDSQPSGLNWTSHGILAKFQDDGGLTLTLFNAVNGEPIWQQMLKHKAKKFEGPPPRGVIVSEKQAIVSSNGMVHGYDLSTGKELFQQKIKRKMNLKATVSSDIQEIRARPDHFVVFGKKNVAAFGLEDGRPLWSEEGFEPPEDVEKRMRAAGLSYAVYAFHHLSPHYTSPEASSLSSGASHYDSGSWQHQSMIQQAEAMQESYAVAQGQKGGKGLDAWVAKIAEIDLDTVNHRLPAGFAAFYRILNFKFGTAQAGDKVNGVLINLDTGAIKEIGVPKAPAGCVTTLLIDPEGDRLIQTYQQLGLMCKEENRINLYRMP